ncbi:flagellar hook-length control protein FliK [Candidatus Margulisiibacteriota bacterium]
MFAPFGQYGFNSWFQYSDFAFQSGKTSNSIQLFSDMELTAERPWAEAAAEPQRAAEHSSPLTNQAIEQATQYFSGQPSQHTLQELLVKSGWLVPNLEGRSLFYQAQLEGKLVSKLDLQFLIDQIISQVKIVKAKGQVELTLGLKPEDLGEILLTLTSRSGLVSIQIQAPPETRKLIEEQMRELELALKKAKINLAEIKITGPQEVSQHA